MASKSGTTERGRRGSPTKKRVAKKKKNKKRAGSPADIEHPEAPVEYAEPAIEDQVPDVEHVESPIEAPAPAIDGERYWPTFEPLPAFYVKARRQRLPCPKCRRILLDDRGQAVACMRSGHDVAFFRCKACDHRWPMAVKEV